MQKKTDPNLARQSREQEIINTAEHFFIQKGFEHTSMDELAAKTGITKRTIYKYFNSKEDLYFAVVLKNTRIMMHYLENAENIPGDGLIKLRSVVKAYQSFAKEKPEAFRLLNYSQFVRSAKTSDYYREVSEIGRGMFARFERLIRTGKNDGTILQDFDESRGIFALFFLVTGFFFRISEIGPGYSSLYGIDEDTISDYAIEIITRIISS